MLEQLQQSLEPILETYGLWLALGLFFLVLVPTLVLFFLRIQQRQGLNTQLQDLLDASGTLYSRLSGLDHSLHQYLAQAETYTGKTLIQVQPLLAPLSESLAQLHRCKVDIKEWEADLAEQDAETAQQTWLAFEKEAQSLIANIEKTEAFFKRLSEVEAALQNQLRQIHELLAPYQQEANKSSALSNLINRLSLLENHGPTADPLTDLEGIRQLLQDAHHWVEKEKQAQISTASPATLADETSEQATVQAIPIQAETVEAIVQAEMPPETEAEPQTEFIPAATVPTPTAQEIAQPEPVSPHSRDEVKLIDQVLDEALEEAAPAPQVEADAEPVLEKESVESGSGIDTTTDVVQSAPDSPAATPSETEASQLTLAPLSSEVKPEEGADKTEKTQTARIKLAARLQSEADHLAQQQARLLPHLAEIRDTLNERFAPVLWESSAKALKRAYYRAEEAALMVKLAQRLFIEPAAPAHRVLLNLQRSAEKWPEIEKLYEQLQHQHQELELAAEQTLQDCKNLLSMLELPDFDDKKHSDDYQKAQSLLEKIIAQFESDQALDLSAAQMELAWVANCIQSWKTPSNPEEESMVAL